MVTLATIVTLSAVFRFLLDGVSLVVCGHSMSFGHVDSLTYGSILTPVLGSHVFSESRQQPRKVDNPDET